MSDTPKPPPLPPTLPLRLVRPLPPDQVARQLRQENDRLREQLEAERALVEVLRQQYVDRTAPHEDTLPGVGMRKPPLRRQKPARRASGAASPGEWALIACILLGLAAGLASLRYPGLMSPIHLVLRALR